MTTLHLRLMFNGTKLGPGKAELMERIAATGSISAAGRQMKMSYKRAWMLVEEMNSLFANPLVTSARGGSGGGGAQLTDTGKQVLHHFRALESAAQSAAAPHIAALDSLCSDMSERK